MADEFLPHASAVPSAVFAPGGRGERICHAVRNSVLGPVLVAATGRGVCMVAFDDRPERLEDALRSRFGEATPAAPDAVFAAWLDAVLAAVGSARARVDVPLDLRGTAFQQTVWRALCAIPAGSTASYRVVAERIGRPGAARAVARACAGNPVALLVPCHRVVREDGGLGGYRWGIERKQRLLDRERG
ncbi:MAG: methylated-DNA--[protein]-cysteine S-methyltransferase [Burkholderiales bacterium]|nr:methylated-DNA--[protein]-cysteine S-methyltransferase [Burkholderiales bacterium]